MSAKVGHLHQSRQTFGGSWSIKPIQQPNLQQTTSAPPKRQTAASPSAGSFRLAPKAVATMAAAATRIPKTRDVALVAAAFLLHGGRALAEPAVPAAEREVPRIGLDAALKQALARNPSARLALLDVKRAETLVAQARAQSLPLLTGNGIYTQLDADRQIAGRVATPESQLQLNLFLQVPIVAPKAWSAWSRAKETVEVAGASEKQARQALVISVARTYLAAIAQERFLDVNAHAKDTALAHEKYARTRFEGGLGNKLDEVRAMQEVATTSAALSTSYASVLRTREALGVLVGSEGPRRPEEKPALGSLPSEAEAELDVKKRPDVAAQMAKQTAAKHQVRDNWVDFMPQLVGTFQPFYQNPATPQFPTTGWQAQLLLSIPFYDGGLRYGVHEARKVEEEAQGAQLESLLRQAKADVRVATEAIRRADEAMRDSREAARLAAESLRLATLAYEAGASTNLEVIDAERRARDAETDVTIKEDAARSARLDLLVASGRFQ